MSETQEDFCPDCPGESGPIEKMDFDLTPDQEAHLRAGGALRVTDTRRSFIRKTGKIAGVIASLGILGKLTVEKAAAATCYGISCPGGKAYLYPQARYSSSCGPGWQYRSCWWYIRCYYADGSYYLTWCFLNCGPCSDY